MRKLEVSPFPQVYSGDFANKKHIIICSLNVVNNIAPWGVDPKNITCCCLLKNKIPRCATQNFSPFDFRFYRAWFALVPSTGLGTIVIFFRYVFPKFFCFIIFSPDKENVERKKCLLWWGLGKVCFTGHFFNPLTRSKRQYCPREVWMLIT